MFRGSNGLVAFYQEPLAEGKAIAARRQGCPRFVRLGLIDEYILMVHPVAIGSGKGMFTNRVNLELVSAKSYTSGVMRMCYRPSSRS